MRLGIRFSPPHGTLSGSQHTVARHTIPALARQHPDYVVFTSNRAAFESLPPDRIVDVPPQTGSGALTAVIAGLARTYRGFGDVVRAAGCDIVYYPYTLESLHRATGFDQLVTVHDMLPLVYPAMYPRTVLLWRRLLLPHLRRTAGIIVPSASTREGLLAQGGFERRRVHVVPQGGAGGVRAAAVVPAHPYLLYVSSSHYPYKNVAFLLDVFARLAERVPHRLVIVGTHHPRFTPGLLAQLRAGRVADRVELLQEVPAARMAELYAGASAFVYPSEYEGFGIPPIEAMASGVPVIAANAASIPEVCGDAALYFEPGDADGALACILGLLEDGRLQATYRQRGLQQSAHYDWDATAAGVLRAARTTLARDAGMVHRGIAASRRLDAPL